MRILFYLDQFPGWGGIESVTATLASAFSACGHDIGIASWMSKPNADQLRRVGRGVRLFQVSDVDGLMAAIRAFSPEIIIFQDDYAVRLPALVNSLGRLGVSPKIITVEHSRPMIRLRPVNGRGVVRLLRQIKRPYLYLKCRVREWRRRRFVYRHSDKYVLLSARYVQLARDLQFGGRKDKFAVVPNPITRIPNGTAVKRKKQVVYVGSLKELKGVDRLLAVWAKIEQARKFDDWSFLIVGDGPDRCRLERVGKQLGLHRVEFVGAVEDPGTIFAESSLMMMASDYEGWPMVLGEGMSNGCVPISTDSFEAVFDILDDQVNGLIVPHCDIDAYYARIAMVMADANRLSAMSVAAVEKSKAFSIERVLSTWRVLLEGLEGGAV